MTGQSIELNWICFATFSRQTFLVTGCKSVLTEKVETTQSLECFKTNRYVSMFSPGAEIAVKYAVTVANINILYAS